MFRPELSQRLPRKPVSRERSLPASLLASAVTRRPSVGECSRSQIHRPPTTTAIPTSAARPIKGEATDQDRRTRIHTISAPKHPVSAATMHHARRALATGVPDRSRHGVSQGDRSNTTAAIARAMTSAHSTPGPWRAMLSRVRRSTSQSAQSPQSSKSQALHERPLRPERDPEPEPTPLPRPGTSHPTSQLPRCRRRCTAPQRANRCRSSGTPRRTPKRRTTRRPRVEQLAWPHTTRYAQP
jgi:hypothetical protein